MVIPVGLSMGHFILPTPKTRARVSYMGTEENEGRGQWKNVQRDTYVDTSGMNTLNTTACRFQLSWNFQKSEPQSVGPAGKINLMYNSLS